jgi:hypothetical protein
MEEKFPNFNLTWGERDFNWKLNDTIVIERYLPDNLRFNFIKFSSLRKSFGFEFHSNKAEIYDVRVRDFYFPNYLS